MQTIPNQIKAVAGNAAVMFAKVIHNRGLDNKLSKEDLFSSLSAACGNKFRPAENSIQVLDNGRVTAVVRAVMVPAIDILPATASESMTSVSANMFMDDQDNMWALRQSDTGSILVSANKVEDPDQILEMMTSCSSASAAVRHADPHTQNVISQYQSDLSQVTGGDMAVWFSESQSKVVAGFVAAEIDDEGQPKLLALSFDKGETNEEVIDRDAVITFLPHSDIQYPETIKVGSLYSSMSASATSERLIAYYRKVYGYSPEYFEKLRGVIINHFG